MLAVGVSGFSLANVPDKNLVNDNINFNKVTPTCYEQTVVNMQNHCGTYTGTSVSPRTTVTCEEGQTEGSTTTYYWTWTEPKPQYPHICECGD